MKNIFIYLLILSVGANIYFYLYLKGLKEEDDERIKLNFWKEISYEEGYDFLKNKMRMDFSETDFDKKPCLVYFWNSTMFDLNGASAMRELDSLASVLGQYSFNYIFATEIDEVEAKDFLTKRGIKFKNFKVLGGMDDFISSVYNERPPKWKRIFGPNNNNTDCPDVTKMKVDGYYVLMDNNGRILYNNYKFSSPVNDSSLIRRLRTFPTIKKIKMLN